MRERANVDIGREMLRRARERHRNVKVEMEAYVTLSNVYAPMSGVIVGTAQTYMLAIGEDVSVEGYYGGKYRTYVWGSNEILQILRGK